MIFGRGMGLATRAGMCRRMGTGFRAGADLVSLCRTEARGGSARHGRHMREVAEHVAAGLPLHEAMRRAGPSYFPPLLVQMVRVGETAGRLERVLLLLADHYEHRLSLRRVFLVGIAWPATQLGAAIVVIGLVILIQGMLAGPGGPAVDASGLGLSGGRGFVIYCLGVAALLALGVLAVAAVMNNWLGLNRLWPLVFRLPVVGPALQTISLSRFCWTLSLALDSGVDAIDSIKLALGSAGPRHYRARGRAAEQAIREGKTMAEAIEATHAFPRDFIQSVEAAEMTGTDAESLERLAVQYDERAKMAVRVLTGVATFAIWAGVVLVLVVFILRLAMNVFGIYDSALEMEI